MTVNNLAKIYVQFCICALIGKVFLSYFIKLCKRRHVSASRGLSSIAELRILEVTEDVDHAVVTPTE